MSYTVKVAAAQVRSQKLGPRSVTTAVPLRAWPPAQADGDLPSVLLTMLGPLAVVAGKLRGKLRSKDAHTDFHVLSDCRGKLCPGTLTLLLAAPGHGKSSLLRAIAGHLPGGALQGRVSYNGEDAAALAARGVNLNLLASYVDQLDSHLPFLTVRETIAFAASLSTVEPRVMESPLLIAAAAERVDRVLRLLHLTNCADTLVGSDAVRGCSGGERKRVSVAEALVSNARVLCLDEISTGLDASVTFEIVAAIRTWARAMRGTVVAALQQPTPEVYDLFDDVTLLREGRTIYHGCRAALPAYLTRLGYSPPTQDVGSVGGDIADWLIHLLTSPSAVLSRRSSLGDRAAVAASGVPSSTAALAQAWMSSNAAPSGNEGGEEAAAPKAAGVQLESAFARMQYGQACPRPKLAVALALVRRQAMLSFRNRTVLITRGTASVVVALVLGLVWLKLTTEQGAAKLGLFVFALAQMSFANFPESSWVVEYKYIGLKQMRAGMYPAWAYTAAATVLHMPIAAVESAAFSLILYFMADLARDGGRWAFFFLIVFCCNMAVGALFRLVAYVVPTPEAAVAAPGPFVALQLVFAGFLIPPKQMGTSMWMVFLYYTSVFAYGARSMAHNEFGSALYDVYPARNLFVAGSTPGGTYIKELGAKVGSWYFTAATCAQEPALQCGGETYGLQSMRVLNINSNPGWKWGGVGFLIFFALLMNVMAARVMAKKAAEKSSRSVGSSYTPDEADPPAAVKVALPSDVSGTLPFTRIVVSWRELSYAVNTPAGSKTLLHGVSGVAQPGRLLALMGASGAGKTTLLDVIACRKTSGSTEGAICLNGFPQERTSFARLTAYCEQQDVHSPLATVTEALQFSAALRLPGSVSADTRAAFISEVTDLLELRPLAGRLIGMPGEAGMLSPSQRKLLTVAVELVSNAPVLFLDEPTSSLDARAALMVMRVVRRVATTGRTVCTTIHQPSTDVFLMFDDVLLMQRGGWMAYFGPLGTDGLLLVDYLQSVPGAHPCPPGMNPASWMLDVLSQTSTDGAALKQLLLESPQWASCRGTLEAACSPAEGAVALSFDSLHARTFAAQLGIVLQRTACSYERSLGYVFTRMKIVTVLCMLFATVWYKAALAVSCAPPQHVDHYVCQNNPTGVQSIVGIIFINALFVSVVCVSALLPYMMKNRVVFYRERASFMYAPEAHSFAHMVVEAPWLLLTILVCLTPLYFMVGFAATASSYFFYIFIIWLCSLCFLALGQWAAALFSTGALAQAVVSLVLPLTALFGGVYLPKSQLPNGAENGHPNVYWLWFYYINPVAHSVEALVPSRFHDMLSSPSRTNHTIAVPNGAGYVNIDVMAFVEKTRGSRYDDRWNQVGYLIAIAGGFQLFHFYAVRFKVHVTR